MVSRRSILPANPHSDFPDSALLRHRLKRFHRLLEAKLMGHDRLDVVRCNKLRQFGHGVARVSTASFDYVTLALALGRWDIDGNLPTLALYSTLGIKLSSIGTFGVSTPGKLIKPPTRVLLILFISVPAPPVSITWSTPLPPVMRRTSRSQSGVFT
jgi:hypothetical protein